MTVPVVSGLPHHSGCSPKRSALSILLLALSIRCVQSLAPASVTKLRQQKQQEMEEDIKSQLSPKNQSRTTEALYEPHRKHDVLFGTTFERSWLHSDMIQLLDAFQNVEADSTTLEDPTQIIPPHLLRVEIPGVYSFQCWNATFLQLLREELANFDEISAKYNIPIRRPNSSTYER